MVVNPDESRAAVAGVDQRVGDGHLALQRRVVGLELDDLDTSLHGTSAVKRPWNESIWALVFPSVVARS